MQGRPSQGHIRIQVAAPAPGAARRSSFQPPGMKAGTEKERSCPSMAVTPSCPSMGIPEAAPGPFRLHLIRKEVREAERGGRCYFGWPFAQLTVGDCITMLEGWGKGRTFNSEETRNPRQGSYGKIL